MRKVYQTSTRKVYASPTVAAASPAGTPTTVRRLHNNSSSLVSPNNNNNAAAVDTTPRILKQTTITRHVATPGQQTHHNSSSTSSSPMKCYVCDCFVGGQGQLLVDTTTASSHTKLPNKIGRVIGDSFLVIVRADDVVCKRCVSLFNQFDHHEAQLETIRSQLMGFIAKKYAIDTSDDHGPASKLQKLNSGHAADPTQQTIGASPSSTTGTPQTVVRKVISQTLPVSPGSRKQPVKIYKCMSCDFTTGDLKQFTPHYSVCPGVAADNNGTTATATATTAASPASASATAINHSGGTAASTISPASKVLARRPVTQSLQKAEASATATATASPAAATTTTLNGVWHQCGQCAFKSQNKTTFDEHVRRHQVKVKPFKCRICSARFEDRETASKHARAHSTEYYKCGTCSVAYRDRNQLIKHFEVHRNDGTGGQQIIIKGSSAAKGGGQQPKTAAAAAPQQNTQKLLQETIDEACNDAAAGAGAAVDAKNIHFFSCGICSLTFIQENYYTAHMETHKQPGGGGGAAQGKKTPAGVKATLPGGRKQAANGKGEVNDDLESIFEKMHSDKSGQSANETSATGIDMPALDQGEDAAEETTQSSAGPVSMPSLDDDGEPGAEHAAEGDEAAAAAANAEGGGVPMEIDDMQSQEGGEQLKFIVNENGQLLQMDNHILTDADGNQIIVQGADSEQLQQLLQSVAMGEGGQIQMIQGENNQMILVQQDGNQLIDASMINADGQIVIQQAGGELSQDGVSAEEQQQVEGDAEQQQEQVQYDASDVAVLAAAAEQHEMLQAAQAAVDENSQEEQQQQEQEQHEGDQPHGETQEESAVATEGEESQEATPAQAEEAVVETKAAAAEGDEDYDQLIPPC